MGSNVGQRRLDSWPEAMTSLREVVKKCMAIIIRLDETERYPSEADASGNASREWSFELRQKEVESVNRINQVPSSVGTILDVLFCGHTGGGSPLPVADPYLKSLVVSFHRLY